MGAADLVVEPTPLRRLRSSLVLATLLRRAGFAVRVATVEGWSREQQGAAYLWAVDFIEGREDVPPPPWLVEAKGTP